MNQHQKQLLKLQLKSAIIEDNFPLELQLQYLQQLATVKLNQLLQYEKNSKQTTVKIYTRQDLIACAVDHVITEALQLLLNQDQFQVTCYYQEGDYIKKNQDLCQIQAPVAVILILERVILNFIQTLSAVATKVKSYVSKIQGLLAINGQPIKITDTRKTIPNLRILEKYAVLVGGGYNQRLGLYDAILIKENNIKNFSDITSAIKFYQQQTALLNKNNYWHSPYDIQVEVNNLQDLKQVLTTPIDMILLDNMSVAEVSTAIQILKSTPFDHNIELEVSGDINYYNIVDYAQTGVHRISIGDLTKNINAINLSMLVQ